MGILFNVTGPGPAWAMGRTGDKKLARAYRPDPTQFREFVQALGRRYSGTYPSGVDTGSKLPRVTLWSIWNEPNWPTWLAPQVVHVRGIRGPIPYAPILYRRLVYAALQGLRASGHGTDQVMIGETQPHGGNPTSARIPMRTGEFIRELFCVDRSLRPFTGRQAAVRGCGIFNRLGPMKVAYFAHHAYTGNKPPTWIDPTVTRSRSGTSPPCPGCSTRSPLAPTGCPEACRS